MGTGAWKAAVGGFLLNFLLRSHISDESHTKPCVLYGLLLTAEIWVQHGPLSGSYQSESPLSTCLSFWVFISRMWPLSPLRVQIRAWWWLSMLQTSYRIEPQTVRFQKPSSQGSRTVYRGLLRGSRAVKRSLEEPRDVCLPPPLSFSELNKIDASVLTRHFLPRVAGRAASSHSCKLERPLLLAKVHSVLWPRPQPIKATCPGERLSPFFSIGEVFCELSLTVPNAQFLILSACNLTD